MRIIIEMDLFPANPQKNLWMFFSPYHDYGKGGRGWRDLWQDCLALLIMEPSEVRQMIIDNYGGVRIDGTNATIIEVVRENLLQTGIILPVYGWIIALAVCNYEALFGSDRGS